MHYLIEVWTQTKPTPKKLDQILKPFEYDLWDWWMIGGRWTGAHDDYDPLTNPENYSVCKWCNGTGTRPDCAVRSSAEFRPATYLYPVKGNGCNACYDTGYDLNYYFLPHDGDVMEAWDVKRDLIAYGLIVSKGKKPTYHDSNGHTIQELLKQCKCKGGWLTTVDMHN